MYQKITIGVIICFLSSVLWGQELNPEPQIIPSVRKWQAGKGLLLFSKETCLLVDPHFPELTPYVVQFCEDVKTQFGYRVDVQLADRASQNSIFFTLSSETQLPEEGYTIAIGETIEVTAVNSKGIFWATRSLLQMLQNENMQLPKGVITDFPAYSHRGFMLDVGRKFFTMDYLKDYVKLLSFYKFNEFQIHLNDNGFVEFFENDWSKTYSAFRLESEVFPGLTAKDGHYTKKEFRELQKMGQRYGVNVIPEIDIPAHSLAFSHFKPEIGSEKYGKDHLDLYNPETYRFIDALYAEYLTGEQPVFIGPDIHIGTDEYDIREAEQYRKFTDRYLRYIQKQGKNVRMWGGLKWLKGKTKVQAEDVIVNAWSYDWVDPIMSLKRGSKLINSCDTWLYIVPAASYYHDFLDEKWLFENWTPEMINRKQTLPKGTKGLLGGMFAVWNDHVGNGISQQDVHYRTLPAIKVLSEKMWKRNTFQEFKTFKKLADSMGEAPGVNLLGRVKAVDSLVLAYAMNSKKEKDLSPQHYDEISRQDVKLNKEEQALSFKEESFVQLPLEEIGYNYTVSFELNIASECADSAILFKGKHSVVLLKKTDATHYQIGFSREGYTYFFATRFPFGEWQHIAISGDYKGTSLLISGKEKERLQGNKRLSGFNKHGKQTYMYIQQTLIFPLLYIGDSKHGFHGMMKNLKVLNC